VDRPVIEFCFDYASPFAYLADYLVDRDFADLPADIERRPVYLRGFELFKQGLPYSAAKTAYLARDLTRCAEHVNVPVGAPARMPINGLYMLRAHIALAGRPAQELFRKAAFRATWVDGADTSDPEVVVQLGETIGVDHRELAAAMGTPAVKAELRANTDRAIDRGVFGVPTFFIGDEMFWGHDRLEYVRRHVERLACGDAEMSDPDDA
jgi:2-hydroxychromene-2-carboxylate isomerase